jgi:acyl-CoA thioester hydrolase
VNDAKPARRPIPRPEHFPHRTVETIRFGDLDRQNHVNNAVFSTFLESGRVIILYGPEYGLRARPQITCTVVFRRAVICQR